MAIKAIPNSSGGSKKKDLSWMHPVFRPKAPSRKKGPIDPNSKSWAPLAPVKSATKAKSATKPASYSPSYSSNSNYSSVGSFSSGGGLPAPSAPSEADYLKGDATYQATISALAKQLQNFTTDIDTQRKNRKLDYTEALKNLGYTPGVDGAEGTWNWTDSLTASGRAYQNLLNDFAARGGLRSSGFADSQNDLTRSLNDQFKGIDTANTQFNTDLDRQLTRAKDENTAAKQAARAEAIMRRAAQYGFGV